MSIFKQIIKSDSELADIVGKPSKLASKKVIKYLDSHCRHFINLSPFLTIATTNNKGKCDSSPRGDGPGFVKVIDDKHLIIPERPGNRRTDTMKNILANQQVGLLFFIPNLEETLRINGTALVIKDEDFLVTLEANGHIPQVAIGVQVEECFLHCAKSLKRSKLWDQNTWPEKKSLPKGAKILSDHANSADLDEFSVAKTLTKHAYIREGM